MANGSRIRISTTSVRGSCKKTVELEKLKHDNLGLKRLKSLEIAKKTSTPNEENPRPMSRPFLPECFRSQRRRRPAECPSAPGIGVQKLGTPRKLQTDGKTHWNKYHTGIINGGCDRNERIQRLIVQCL